MLLLGLWSTILSCKKITNVNLADPLTAGDLNYKVVDDSGNGLSGVKVSIYENRVYSNYVHLDRTALVDTVRTNRDGVAFFSKLIAANYLIVTDSPTVNHVKYTTREFIQVTAGTEKKKVVKASEFSGLLNINVYASSDFRTPLNKMGVAAIPNYSSVIYGRVQYVYGNVKDFIGEAAITGITNELGFVSLKIPSNVTYTVIIYSLNKNVIGYGYDNYLIQKDASLRLSLPMIPDWAP